MNRSRNLLPAGDGGADQRRALVRGLGALDGAEQQTGAPQTPPTLRCAPRRTCSSSVFVTGSAANSQSRRSVGDGGTGRGGKAAQRRQALAAEQGRQHGAHDGEDLLCIAAERRPTGELHARIKARLDEAIASRFRVQRSQLDSWARSADAERRGEQAANAQRSASYAEALRLARQGYEVRNF